MRKVFFVLFAFSLPAQASVLRLPHQAVTLENGMKVFMVKYPSPGVVAYQLAVHAGSRNEVEKGKTGFAHFFEHLMFRGTKKRTSQEFGEVYVRLGCENNAFTSDDVTNYNGVVASIYLPQILEAESDRFKNLSFDEKALRDEAGAVLGEYNKDVAQPEFMLEEKLMATAFTKHPYGHTTMGYKEDILNFTERYKDVWPFFRRYYRPGNVAIVLVGDIDFKKTLEVIRKSFGDWKNPQVEPVEIPQEPAQTEAREAEVKLEKPTQTRVTIAYKIPAFSSRNGDMAALDLFSEIYFSVTSEFQKKYRFEKKWLDHVSAGATEQADPGLWGISLRLSEAGEGKERELIKAVEQTIAEARNQVATENRMLATKKRFKNEALIQWFSAPEHLADRIAWYTNLEPDFGVLDRVQDRLNEITAEQVRAYANTHLIDARKTTVILKGAKP